MLVVDKNIKLLGQTGTIFCVLFFFTLDDYYNEMELE